MPKLSSYWLGVAIAIAALSALWLILFAAQLGQPMPETRWMAEAYAIKWARAQSVPSPKVVVLAGSSALFSIDSGLLETAWGRPVVNLGVNAALGLEYLLRTAEPYLKCGDLVLMPLEYPLYQGERRLNAQLIDHVIGQDLAYWRALTWGERLRFIAQLSPARLVAGLRRPMDPRPVGAGLYGGNALDERGDHRRNDWAVLDPAERAAVAAAHAEARSKRHTYGHQDRPDAPGWRRLQHFHQRLRAQHITLWMVPPALMDQPSYHQDPIERHYYQTLPQRVRALGIPFFGAPESFMYPPEDFFDTPYHLTAKARTRHTQALLAQLPPPPLFCPNHTKR